MSYWLHKTLSLFSLRIYHLLFLCKCNMGTEVQYASLKSQKQLLTFKWFAEEVTHSPQPVIVQDRHAKPLLKSSLRQSVLSAYSTCTAECHNYFYHISGACEALTRGEVSLLNSFASQSHTHTSHWKKYTHTVGEEMNAHYFGANVKFGHLYPCMQPLLSLHMAIWYNDGTIIN